MQKKKKKRKRESKAYLEETRTCVDQNAPLDRHRSARRWHFVRGSVSASLLLPIRSRLVFGETKRRETRRRGEGGDGEDGKERYRGVMLTLAA